MKEWMTQEFCADAVLAGLTVICAATDLRSGKVYNIVTLPGLCLGLLLALVRSGAPGILEVLCSAGFAVLALFPFYRAGGLGAGDIKLLAAVSAFMPAGSFLRCFAASFCLGAAVGVLRLAVSGGRTHTVHFAVPVAAGVLLHLAGFY